MDLRGETTTVVDPCARLDLDGTPDGNRIVVLSEHAGTDLLVDDVHDVESTSPDSVGESAASETTRGVLRRDDRFVVWVDPDAFV